MKIIRNIVGWILWKLGFLQKYDHITLPSLSISNVEHNNTNGNVITTMSDPLQIKVIKDYLKYYKPKRIKK